VRLVAVLAMLSTMCFYKSGRKLVLSTLLAEHDCQAAQIEFDASKKHCPDEAIGPSITKQINQRSQK
jgi:hypothetical protein